MGKAIRLLLYVLLGAGLLLVLLCAALCYTFGGPDWVGRFPAPSGRKTILIDASCFGTSCGYSASLERWPVDRDLGPLPVGDVYGPIEPQMDWNKREDLVQWRLGDESGTLDLR